MLSVGHSHSGSNIVTPRPQNPLQAIENIKGGILLYRDETPPLEKCPLTTGRSPTRQWSPVSNPLLVWYRSPGSPSEQFAVIIAYDSEWEPR